MKCNYNRKKEKPLSKEHQQLLSAKLAEIMLQKLKESKQ